MIARRTVECWLVMGIALGGFGCRTLNSTSGDAFSAEGAETAPPPPELAEEREAPRLEQAPIMADHRVKLGAGSPAVAASVPDAARLVPAPGDAGPAPTASGSARPTDAGRPPDAAAP